MADWSSTLDKQREIVFALTIIAFLYVLNLFLNARRSQKYPPGPIGLPVVGYLPFLGQKPFKTVLELSKKHRSKIISLRLGRELVVFLNDYESMKEVLNQPAALYRDREAFGYIPEIGFGGSGGEEWSEQRKFCMQSTKDLGLGRRGPWQTLVQEGVRDFVVDLSTYKGKPVDISDKLSTAITKNIISLFFGRKLDPKEDAELIKLAEDYSHKSLAFSGPYEPTSFIPQLFPVLAALRIGGYHEVTKIISQFHNVIKQEIAKHKQLLGSQEVDDFINLYLKKMKQMQASDGQHYFTDKNLEGNVAVFFLAGNDTMFGALSWLLPLMAEHREIQRKVHEELDEVFGKEGVISYEDRFQIPYTFAVILENERHSHFVPFSGARRSNANIEVNGYTIPKGTPIISNLWAVNHDPNNWKEPHKFMPERFLEPSGRKLLKTPPGFATFSIGKRNCPGETIAQMEVMSIFASVMQKFEVVAPDGVKLKFESQEGLICPLKPQPLCFKERT